jgi:hypothetical protein
MLRPFPLQHTRLFAQEHVYVGFGMVQHSSSYWWQYLGFFGVVSVCAVLIYKGRRLADYRFRPTPSCQLDCIPFVLRLSFHSCIFSQYYSKTMPTSKGNTSPYVIITYLRRNVFISFSAGNVPQRASSPPKLSSKVHLFSRPFYTDRVTCLNLIPIHLLWLALAKRLDLGQYLLLLFCPALTYHSFQSVQSARDGKLQRATLLHHREDYLFLFAKADTLILRTSSDDGRRDLKKPRVATPFLSSPVAASVESPHAVSCVYFIIVPLF